ncbi:glycerol dehydrogenase [Enterococcus asini]|uniref:glycerol dehydrogenase n=1 Tax=Enterococcus asini TaxID=57732 RepID=UPI0028913042|nr:glycerol dehydrogenase [Enterococcus asini]MDT2756882.1 glycerol dehydrogenase [Enterococcus asini]
MIRSFRSPQKYVQGPGVFATQLQEVKKLGNEGLLVTDDFVWQLVGSKIAKDLEQLGMKVHVLLVAEVDLAKWTKSSGLEVIIGLGGGRVMDVAKTLANKMQARCAILPTSAATDAPTSSISVIYDEQGYFVSYDHYQFNPDLVLVDSQVIFDAPGKFLVQGIADGLCTYIEASTVAKWEKEDSKPTIAALTLAKACCDTLFKQGKQALQDQQTGLLSQAFEDVIEANILLSGLGFENGGLSIAHAFHNALLGDPSLQVTASHGEIVGIGLLLQLVLERQTDRSSYQDFMLDLGLPKKLSQLGVFLTKSQKERLAEEILAAKHKGNPFDPKITKEELMEALTGIME